MSTDLKLFAHAEQLLTLVDPSADVSNAHRPRAGRAMSELGLHTNFSVVVRNGIIAWVGPVNEAKSFLQNESQAPEVIDCRGKVVMPALVDSHTHVVWGGHRCEELEMRLAGADYETIFAAGGGILASVRQIRALSEDELYEQSLRRLKRMRQCGTTTFEIKSGYGLDVQTELRQLRVIQRLRTQAGYRTIATCLAAHAIPVEFSGSEAGRREFIELICTQILPAVAKEKLADFCDVFCDRGAFTVDEARTIFHCGQSLGLKPRVHANEFGHTGGAMLASELQAACADHLIYLDDCERKALRTAGVVATLLPGTSLVLGKPYANGRALVQANVPVAIATDCNPGSCAFENLALVLALACYGCQLSPAEAICAVTHNAAASLGVANKVGRIAPGMLADLLILATSDYRDLVYHGGSPLVCGVYQQGQRVG